MEDVSRKEYQQQKGHNVTTYRTGLVTSVDHPWMAAIPDDRVFDPTSSPSWGLVEYLIWPDICLSVKPVRSQASAYRRKETHTD